MDFSKVFFHNNYSYRRQFISVEAALGFLVKVIAKRCGLKQSLLYPHIKGEAPITEVESISESVGAHPLERHAEAWTILQIWLEPYTNTNKTVIVCAMRARATLSPINLCASPYRPSSSSRLHDVNNSLTKKRAFQISHHIVSYLACQVYYRLEMTHPLIHN